MSVVLPVSSVSPGRRGVATIWALVVLAVITVLMATMAGQFLAGRRLLDRRADQAQAEWLARAGIELAAARILMDPAGYNGESVDLLPGSRVRIEVRREKGADTFVVTSEARHPDKDLRVIRTATRRLRRTADKDRTRIEVVYSGHK